MVFTREESEAPEGQTTGSRAAELKKSREEWRSSGAVWKYREGATEELSYEPSLRSYLPDLKGKERLGENLAPSWDRNS